MQCPRCGFENPGSSAYCEQCGTLLNALQSLPDQTELSAPQMEFSQYSAPPPPPLNGHETIPPPPPLEYNSYAVQSHVFPSQKVLIRPGIGILSTILYFIGALIAAFGLIGTIVTFNTTGPIASIAVLSGFFVLIVSIVVFILIRRRSPLLRWWQRLLWLLGATIVGFIALVIEAILAPGPLVTNYIIGCVFILYGLAWAAIALW